MTFGLKKGALTSTLTNDQHDMAEYLGANIRPRLFHPFFALKAKNVSGSRKRRGPNAVGLAQQWSTVEGDSIRKPKSQPKPKLHGIQGTRTWKSQRGSIMLVGDEVHAVRRSFNEFDFHSIWIGTYARYTLIIRGGSLNLFAQVRYVRR